MSLAHVFFDGSGGLDDVCAYLQRRGRLGKGRHQRNAGIVRELSQHVFDTVVVVCALITYRRSPGLTMHSIIVAWRAMGNFSKSGESGSNGEPNRIAFSSLGYRNSSWCGGDTLMPPVGAATAASDSFRLKWPLLSSVDYCNCRGGIRLLRFALRPSDALPLTRQQMGDSERAGRTRPALRTGMSTDSLLRLLGPVIHVRTAQAEQGSGLVDVAVS